MAINIPLTAILLVVVASFLGMAAWWVTGRLGGKPWLATFLMLLVFGLILVFGHIT